MLMENLSVFIEGDYENEREEWRAGIWLVKEFGV
jgi:hypothetical protein